MGVSISHYLVTAGTAGCIVVDDKGNEYILSNNHVLAASNMGRVDDPIVQPGTVDGGIVPRDVVAHLYKYEKIKFPGTCVIAKSIATVYNKFADWLGRKTRLIAIAYEFSENTVDAAIAKPLSKDLYTREILGIGIPKGMAVPKEGDRVIKSGRSSGVTEGIIIDDDATLFVNYGDKMAKFVHQLIIVHPEGKQIVAPGDSGSALLREDGYVVGLVFAGSTDGKYMVANRIEYVAKALGIKITETQ